MSSARDIAKIQETDQTGVLKEQSGAQAAPGSVSIRKVSKYFGSLAAVKDLSLEIPSGKFVAILGPSGSGKTTLLNLVAGFLKSDEGSIWIGGRDVRNAPPYERQVGVVFQQYALFPHMTVEQNISFPLEMRRFPKEEIGIKVQNALEMVELSGFQNRLPNQLSGGQQQRVALARALVYAPPILLFDEPLGALDRRLRDAMQSELKELHQKLGITFIYVTHDQEEALALADTVVVTRSGQIEQQGEPSEIYDSPRSRFVANFVGDCNIWPGEIRQVGKDYEIYHKATGIVLHRGKGSDCPQKKEAFVAIRPEWFVIGEIDDPNLPPPQTMAGKKSRERFRGSEVILECETPLGPTIVRVTRQTRGKSEISGNELKISWISERTVLLESD